MSVEALARTAAMNARLRAQPEPAPERPEWVRVVQRRVPYTFPAVGSVVRVRSWRSSGEPMVDAESGGMYVLHGHEWEPADPPTPEPGEERWAGEGDIEPVDRPAGADLSGKSAPAAEWKVGDWFTAVIDYDDDVTDGKPYQVVYIYSSGLSFKDDVGQKNIAHWKEGVTRCDPPSDPQPASVDDLRERHCYINSVDSCCHCGDCECDGIGCIASLSPDDREDDDDIENLHEMLRAGQAWQAMCAVIEDGGSLATAHGLAAEALAYAENRTPEPVAGLSQEGGQR